ncbi:MAG: SET domain-containing protein-lysine N-methyltransferase [Anaerolineaceae bacterium]|nr:SET domain-containing protein-lysine N-methyltransferase [Anaerolineaceae bacterium]
METKTFYSYLTPKLKVRACPEKGGFGLFAEAPIKAGELLTMWGGRVVTEEQLAQLSLETQTHGIQVDEELYQVPLVEGDPADYFNHSCNPNAGLSSPISLVAIRDVPAGEEVCFDYAMSDSSDYDEFECHCGAPNCRKRITGRDWMLPDLHARYMGFFSPYLQRRIAVLLQKEKGNGKHKPEELNDTVVILQNNR